MIGSFFENLQVLNYSEFQEKLFDFLSIIYIIFQRCLSFGTN